MAAFTFPENPANGDTTLNPDTNITYVYRNPPGKWEVQMRDNAADFVDVTGDTMTGQLHIASDAVLPGGNILLTTSNYTTKNLNHLLYAQGPSNGQILGVTADGYTTTHHMMSCTSSPAYFTSGGSPNTTPGYCAFQILGPAVGDTTNLPYPSRLSPILRTWYNFDGTGTGVRYFGMIDDAYDIVNKSYVDSQNVLKGGVIKASGGTADTTGQVVLFEDSGTANSGQLMLKDAVDSTNTILYPNGDIDTRGSLSFTSNVGAQYIKAYGNASKTLAFQVGPDANSLTTGILLQQNQITVQGPELVQTSAYRKRRGVDGTSDFKIEGATTSAPTTSDGALLQVYRNTLTSTSLCDAVSYFGLTGNPSNIQTNQSVKDLINGGTLDPTFLGLAITGNATVGNNLSVAGTTTVGSAINFTSGGTTTITNGDSSVNYLLNNKGLYFYKAASNNASDLMFTLNGDQNSTSYGVKAWMDILVEGTIAGSSGYGKAGLQIYSTGVTTNQLWTTKNPASFYIQTGTGNLIGQHNVFVYGGNNGNSYYLRISKNNGFNQGDVSTTFAAQTDAAGDTKCYAYTDWGTSYSNVDTLSDNVIVTLGVLRSRGLLTTATYTTSGGYDETSEQVAEDTLLSAQSSVSIPAQCTFEGLPGTGTGFTLIGPTVAAPTNTNAKLLQVYFSTGAAATVEYFGNTTRNDSIQTKTSTQSLINSTAVVAGTWSFINLASNDPNTTMDSYYLVDYKKDTDDIVTVITKARKNTAIVAGDVVATLPAAFRPTNSAHKFFQMGSEDFSVIADAVIKTNGQITILNVSGSTTKLNGQCVFTIYNPDA